jgi:hypothetical protein
MEETEATAASSPSRMVVRETLPQHHLNGDDYMLLLHRIFYEDYSKLARMDRGNLVHFKRHVDRSMLSERNISKLPKCMSCLASEQRRKTYRATDAEIEARRSAGLPSSSAYGLPQEVRLE